MRIQKYFSEQGILSRRETEEYIRQGFIAVNGGIVTDLGRQIDPAVDRVEIVNRTKSEEKRTIAFNKPIGIVCSREESEGQTIFDILPEADGLNTVGRLDKESEGLILLSNDGIITKKVTGEDHTIEKEYEVEVREDIKPWMLAELRSGPMLDGKPTIPATVEFMDKHSFRIILKEGRKHQIRRMADFARLNISNLKRVRIGPVRVKGIRPGSFRPLTAEEIAELKK
jgi:pseudouridine synthase